MARCTAPAVSAISSALPYELSRTTSHLNVGAIEPRHNASFSATEEDYGCSVVICLLIKTLR